ncbi:RDD family protein [Streptomyces sp. NPDC004838]
MSFGDPNNPYGQQQGGQQQPGYGYPQDQQGQQPGYGYPQAPPVQPYGADVPPHAGYGGGMPPLAHWGLRAGGYIIDLLIVLVPYLILITVGAAIGTDAQMIFLLLGVAYALGVGLWIIYQEGTTGQTPGKKAVGIRLLRERDGQPLGFGMAFVRKLAHILDNLACYIGWLWPIWDSKKQTFADKVCSTVVIKSN